MWQTKGSKQARYVCAVVQLVFHVEKGSKVFVPIPETGDPYIFLVKVPLFKPRSQELWLQIQITSKIIQVFLRDPVWLIATSSWICRLNNHPKILTRQNPPLKEFLHLMRKEDPYLLLKMCNTIFEGHQPPALPARQPLPMTARMLIENCCLNLIYI